MNLNDQVPVVVCHVFEADIPQNAGIVEEDVNPPKFLDSRIDDPITILDAVIIRNGLSACSSYLIYYHVCGLQEIISQGVQGRKLEKLGILWKRSLLP